MTPQPNGNANAPQGSNPPPKKFSPEEVTILVKQAEQRESIAIGQEEEQIAAGMIRRSKASLEERNMRIRHAGEATRLEAQINNQVFTMNEAITSQVRVLQMRQQTEKEELIAAQKTKEATSPPTSD